MDRSSISRAATDISCKVQICEFVKQIESGAELRQSVSSLPLTSSITFRISLCAGSYCHNNYSSPRFMLVTVTVVFLALLVSFFLYMRAVRWRFKTTIRSISVDVLIAITVISIILSYVIAATDTVFICDIRVTDFFINVCNGLHYSILIVWLASQVSTNSTIQSKLFRINVTCFFVIFQLILAALAHFANIEERQEGTGSLVMFCYNERSKTAVVLSYGYGFVLMFLSVALICVFIYRNKNYCNRKAKIAMAFLAFITLSALTTNGVALSYVLWPNKEEDCEIYANFYVVLALFPAIISVICCCYGHMISIYIADNRRQTGEHALVVYFDCVFTLL